MRDIVVTVVASYRGSPLAEGHQRGFIMARFVRDACTQEKKPRKSSEAKRNREDQTGRTINLQCREVDGRIHAHIGYIELAFLCPRIH